MSLDIWEYMKEFHMVQRGDLVLSGVSGGADSVSLLLLLHELKEQAGCQIRVIHVEHGIRGEESRQDAQFVKELCDHLQVPIWVISVNVPEYARKYHMGLEETARKLRYEAFDKVAMEAAAEGWKTQQIKIALAHHMEDNAETILFQMLRGSGISGLCGIQPVREHEKGYFFIRPLLFLQRQQIEDFLQERGQDYRSDATNQDVTYARNRLRNRVFPELVHINEQAVLHIGHTASQLYEIQDYLISQTFSEMKRIVSWEEESCQIDILKLSVLHPALQKELLRQAFFRVAGQRKDFGTVHVEHMIRLTAGQSGKRLSLPYGIEAIHEYDRLILMRRPKQESKVSGNMTENTEAAVDGVFLEAVKSSGQERIIELPQGQKLAVRIFPYSGDHDKIKKKPYTKWLDYDKIKGGFIIRNRRPGDYFCMDESGHRKKLKKYLADEKVPASQRQQMWLLAMDSQVIWLIGGRISEDCKVSDQTAYVTEVSYFF